MCQHQVASERVFTRDVTLCSSIHTAHGQEKVERRMKDNEGHWTVKDVPVLPAIKDFNQYVTYSILLFVQYTNNKYYLYVSYVFV